MIYTDITSRALTYLLKRPGLHIDMTEAVYRGLGEILYAEPDGVLLLVHAKGDGGAGVQGQPLCPSDVALLHPAEGKHWSGNLAAGPGGSAGGGGPLPSD